MKCRVYDDGREVEHRDAWRLVQIGEAEPADDACREAAGLDEEEIQRRREQKDAQKAKIAAVRKRRRWFSR